MAHTNATLSRNFLIWKDLQTVIGAANRWPIHIRRLFWTVNLRAWQRVIIAGFVWVNNLNPVIFEEWALELGLYTPGSSGASHFAGLFKLFEDTPTDSGIQHLYGWNVKKGHYYTLKGERKFHVQKSALGQD